MTAQIKGGIIVLTGAIMFSTKAILVKLAYQHDVDSVSLLMLRMLFSLPVFLLIGFLSLRKNKKGRAILKLNLWKVMALGILGYYVASYFDLEGLRFIDASLERIILFIYPTIVVLLNFILFKERPTFIQLVAIVITYIGTILAFKGNLNVNDAVAVYKGGGLVLIAALTYGMYLVGTGSLASKVGSGTYNSVGMSAAAIAIIIHNLFLNGFNLFTFTSEVYMYGLLIAIFSTIIPSYLIVEGIRIIGSNNSSIIGSIGPISTILLAIIILGERVVLLQGVGSIVVILGVVLILLHSRRPREAHLVKSENLQELEM